MLLTREVAERRAWNRRIIANQPSAVRAALAATHTAVASAFAVINRNTRRWLLYMLVEMGIKQGMASG